MRRHEIGHLLATRWAIVLCGLALVYWQVPVLAVSALVQSKFLDCGDLGAGNTCVITFDSNVTTGNAVIVVGNIYAEGNSFTMTFSDATNGSYTTHQDQISGDTTNTTSIGSKRNLTGGFTQVTITTSGTDPQVLGEIYEVSGLDNSASVQSGKNTDGSASTSHTCSTTALTGTGFALCASHGDSDTGGFTLSGFTQDGPNNFVGFLRATSTTLSSSQGVFTTANSVTMKEMAMGLWVQAGCAIHGLAILGVGC